MTEPTIDIEKLAKICPEMVVENGCGDKFVWDPNQGRSKKRIEAIARRFLDMADRQKKIDNVLEGDWDKYIPTDCPNHKEALDDQ